MRVFSLQKARETTSQALRFCRRRHQENKSKEANKQHSAEFLLTIPITNRSKTMLVFHAALSSVLLLSLDPARGFGIQSTGRPHTRLSVANDVTEQQEQKVPYEIARGDGSTGGGGLPMPTEEDYGLVRPKVRIVRVWNAVSSHS